jgi:hypothetical protein
MARLLLVVGLVGTVVLAASAAFVRDVGASDVSMLVGTWERRDAQLVVGDSGAARLQWRTGWCSTEPPPCDRVDADDVFIYGAFADLRLDLTETDPDTIGAYVDLVNAPGVLEPGPAFFAMVGSDLVELRQGSHIIQLCRPPRELTFCDPLPPSVNLSDPYTWPSN